MSSYGLTSVGLIRPTYQDVFNALVSDIQAAPNVGNIRQDSGSIFGQLLAIISKKTIDLWEVLDAIYQSRSITAEGTALDDIVAWSGISRIPASKAEGHVVMFGTNGITISTGMTVRNYITGDQFVLNSSSPLTISNTNMAVADIEITGMPTSGTVYTITIDGIFTYTSLITDTIITVATELVDLINASSVFSYAIDNGDGTFRVISNDLTNGGELAVYVTGSYISLTQFGTAMPFIAQEYGANISGAVGSINIIITPVTGLSSVENVTFITPGIDTENDADLRSRFLLVRSSLGRSTLNAIYNAIVQGVPDLVSASVYEDLTAHSIECVVQLPTSQYATLAQVIFDNKAAGILTTGTSYEYVTDSQGNIHTIYFTIPTVKYIHVQVTLTKSSEIAFPVNGNSIIANAILTEGTSLKVGNDVIYQSFYKAVYSVSGVTAATISIASTSTPTGTPSYSSANIAMSIRELADFDLSRIHIS